MSCSLLVSLHEHSETSSLPGLIAVLKHSVSSSPFLYMTELHALFGIVVLCLYLFYSVGLNSY